MTNLNTALATLATELAAIEGDTRFASEVAQAKQVLAELQAAVDRISVRAA